MEILDAKVYVVVCPDGSVWSFPGHIFKNFYDGRYDIVKVVDTIADANKAVIDYALLVLQD